jgi:CheY-like chemotaxis protein
MRGKTKRTRIGWRQWQARPRVLVEDPDPAWQQVVREFLAASCNLAFCTGPERLPGGCSLVEQGRCPLAEAADLILTSLNLDRVENREVVSTLPRFCPGVPVIALVSKREAREYQSYLHGCRVEPLPTTTVDLQRLVAESVVQL